jgi:hypothetical protein
VGGHARLTVEKLPFLASRFDHPPPDVLISDSTAGPVGQPLHPFHRGGALPRGTFKDGVDGGIMPNKDAARPSPEPISRDTAQRAVEAVATLTENFAPSPAEPMRGSSKTNERSSAPGRSSHALTRCCRDILNVTVPEIGLDRTPVVAILASL